MINHRSEQRRYEFRLFLSYCVIFYFIPFILIVIFGNPLEISYRPRPNYIIGLLYAIMSILVFWWALTLPRIRFTIPKRTIEDLFYGRRASIVLTIGFFAISVWSAINLGLDFRHKGETLSELGAIGFVLAIAKIYASTAILVHYRLVKEGVDTYLRSAILFAIGASFIINIQTSFEFLIATAAFVGATHKFRRKIKLTGHQISRASIIVLPVLLVCVFYFGKANKIGSEDALRLISNFDLLFYSFLQRYGYHMYSLATHTTENFLNFYQGLDAIQEVVKVSLFRLSAIFGLGIERPELGTVARMNFFVLSDSRLDRIGTSPGMLGSTFFFPGGGFAIFYYVFIIRFVMSLFWRIAGTKQNSWLFLIVTILLMATTLDSAPDSFNPLSNGFIRVFFLFLGGNFILQKLRHSLQNNSAPVNNTQHPKKRAKFSYLVHPAS